MRLIIGTKGYNVQNAPQTEAGVFWKIRLEPEDIASLNLPISGKITLKANSGFVLAKVDTADYQRQYIDGVFLVLSNQPEPEPEPEPEPDPEPEGDVWDDLANAIREGVNDVD